MSRFFYVGKGEYINLDKVKRVTERWYKDGVSEFTLFDDNDEVLGRCADDPASHFPHFIPNHQPIECLTTSGDGSLVSVTPVIAWAWNGMHMSPVEIGDLFGEYLEPAQWEHGKWALRVIGTQRIYRPGDRFWDTEEEWLQAMKKEREAQEVYKARRAKEKKEKKDREDLEKALK